MNTLSNSSQLKCTTTIRLLAYGVSCDFVDESSASIANEGTNTWVHVIREIYQEDTYDNLH